MMIRIIDWIIESGESPECYINCALRFSLKKPCSKVNCMCACHRRAN